MHRGDTEIHGVVLFKRGTCGASAQSSMKTLLRAALCSHATSVI